MSLFRPEGSISVKFKGYRLKALEDAMCNGDILEAPAVKCDGDLCLYLDLGPNIVGVIPFEEFEYNINNRETKNIAIISRVAKSTCFKVIGITVNPNGEVLVKCSRKQAQMDCYKNFISKLKLGQVIDARINHIEKYGAFCDIGCGLVALLPVENFSVARIRDSKESLKQFKNLKVVIKEIDDDGKILLTHKELLGTWEEEAAKFNAGDVVVGIVRMTESYGIFIELTPNLAGLAEVDGAEGVKEGDAVSVYIKSIIPEKMKVKLMIVNTDNVVKPFIKLDYRIPDDGFIKTWVYSPESCNRVIKTEIG